jgi:lauroyl/myristoyl acyltransferase
MGSDNAAGAADPIGAPAEPAIDAHGAATDGRRPLSAPESSLEGTQSTDSRAPKSAAAPTKAFVAPHKMEQETFLTHLAGLTLLSFWRTSSWVVGHLPSGLTYRVGGWISMIGYGASAERRRWLRANFSHVLGVSPDDKAAGRMARMAYRNYARYILELMRLPWLSTEQAENLLEVEGLDKFLQIYNASKGLVLVAAHLGNNEAVAAGFAKHGLQINVVGDDSSYRELYELFERQRESWGVKMISWRNLRGVYGALRRREGLVLLVDWGYRADGIPVKMFDCWTTLPAGPALLAAKHGSAIVPFCINRMSSGTFHAYADDPIHVASDSPRDLAIATQAIATALESHIAPAPEQWYIFKPIWPLTEAEQTKLEERHQAAMANDARGAAPNGRPNGKASTESTAGRSIGAGANAAGAAAAAGLAGAVANPADSIPDVPLESEGS